jgi:hypothetical protein
MLVSAGSFFTCSGVQKVWEIDAGLYGMTKKRMKDEHLRNHPGALRELGLGCSAGERKVMNQLVESFS